MYRRSVTARPQPPAFARMAGHPVRWLLLTILAHSDRRVRELVGLTGQPQSLISYHLHLLRGSGLVTARRSSFDGRDVYYHLDLTTCARELAAAGVALHPGLRPAGPPDPPRPLARGDELTMIFLCTGNSARSQIAEMLIRKRSLGRVRAVSAGSKPKPVHPNTARVLADYGIDAARRESRHVSQFTDRPFHYVVTLCDKVREVCPQFAGGPAYVHWSIADPSASGSTDDDTLPAFRSAAAEINTRVGFLLSYLLTAAGSAPG